MMPRISSGLSRFSAAPSIFAALLLTAATRGAFACDATRSTTNPTPILTTTTSPSTTTPTTTTTTPSTTTTTTVASCASCTPGQMDTAPKRPTAGEVVFTSDVIVTGGNDCLSRTLTCTGPVATIEMKNTFGTVTTPPNNAMITVSCATDGSGWLYMNDPTPAAVCTVIDDITNTRSSCQRSSAEYLVRMEFTEAAATPGVVDLGQGFPNTPTPSFLTERLAAIAALPERTDLHQYTRGYGHPPLVSALAKLYSRHYGREIDADSELLLSLYYAFHCWIDKGDEVILLEPAYDSYKTFVTSSGGTPVPVELRLREPSETSAYFVLDVDAVRAAITHRTKMLVINNPNNPNGKVFSREELAGLAAIAEEFDLLVLADEVYEWYVFDDAEMIRFASQPGMFPRTISVGSAGKTFAATGWKIGWTLAPAPLLSPMRRLHEHVVFTCSTPTQHAVAEAIERELALFDRDPSESYLLRGLEETLKEKRIRVAAMLRAAGFHPIMPQGGYFILARFDSLRWADSEPEAEVAEEDNSGDSSSDSASSPPPADFSFVRRLCGSHGLAVIPASAFYSEQFKNDKMIRVCFFKKDETLDQAGAILRRVFLHSVNV